MPELKGKKSELSHLVLTSMDLAQVEGVLVLSALRGAVEAVLAMAQEERTPEIERAILSQYVTLKGIRDELVSELTSVEVALAMIHAHLTDLEISLG